MTREEYDKRLNWLFPQEEDFKYPARILIRGVLETNFNHHNIKVVKKMCISKMHQLIGIDEKEKALKIKW